jgi:galactoside O-acetyltransferase
MIGKMAKFIYFDIGFIIRYWFWKLIIQSMGGKIGKNVKFYGGVRINGNSPGAIDIGNEVRILRNVTISTSNNGKIQIGDKTHIGEGTIIFSDIGIKIGNNVIIGPQNIIVDFDHIYKHIDIPINNQGINRKEVIIEEDVWISSHCVITKGVRIEKGSVIGAGSVVNKNVPAYSVVAGIPIQVIKKRGDN